MGASVEANEGLRDMAEVSTFGFDVKQKNIITFTANGKVCPR